ncbi:hypothetical protein L873DRAFT_1941015 [Choiromyces venosus 120613-1]|uniref:Uncharacterized protein n=1 Tax=Choiromyces venosus 120613-1 TaxID=1336337 RepID=A0A3N4JBI5_9PEZI|nr:hypothetical protein L873DRAFT_1941015 [Choiromyces venosus 120613-1]
MMGVLTDSLVGEHLDTYALFADSPGNLVVKAGCTTPSPIHDLTYSEHALYGKFTLDRSSDQDYIPTRRHSTPVGLFGASPMTRSGAKDLLRSCVPVPAPKDVVMSLGAGLTMEKDGLGDSVHASSPPHDDDVVNLVGSSTTDYSSMPLLPSTVVHDDAARMAMTSGQGADTPGSVCSDESMDNSNGSAGSDDMDLNVKRCLHMIDNLLVEVDLLSRRVLDLENDRSAQTDTFNETPAKFKEFTPAHVDAMAVRWPIVKAVSRKDKGKGKAVDVPTPAVPAIPASSTSAPRQDPVPPSDIPPVAPISSCWSSVAATSLDDESFTVVSSRKGRRSTPGPGPSLTAHERHVAIYIEKHGLKVLIPPEIAAMRLSLNGFSFCQDTKKIKILISQLPLSPAGVRGSWEVADWQNDNSFNDLIWDLEVTNSDHGSIMVYSRRRPIWIWAELKATSICNCCLHHGHVVVMCRAPVACKFCTGGHLSRDHSYPVRDCTAATGSLYTHVNLECHLCSHVGHLTGDPSCPDLKVSSPTSSLPCRDKMVSDETSPQGVTDGSIQKVFPDPQQVQTESVIDQKIAAESAAMKPASQSHSNSL